MRRLAPLPLLGLLALAGCFDQPSMVQPEPDAASANRGAASQAQPIPDQYIIVFRPGGPEPRGLARRLAEAHGGEVIHTYEHALKGFAARFPAQAIQGLRRNPNILLIEQDVMDFLPEADTLDYPGIIDHPDGVAQEGATWGIDRVDQRDMPLDGRYVYANTGAGVNVYVIDSGIRTTHQEFGGRASLGIDFVGDGNAVSPGDCSGHGTHVAGTIGGATYGVAKGVSLVSVRIFPCTGAGGSPRSRTIASVDWVTGNGVHPAVVNMSLGGNNEGFPGLSSLDMAVENSIAAGFTYAIAAGNESTDACTRSPARAPNALTVGAINQGDMRRGTSNFGTCVDLFAPGGLITSAGFVDDTGARTISGTSMAAPHVAGAAALYLQLHPTAAPSRVNDFVVRNATRDRLTDTRPGSPNLLLVTNTPAPIDIRPDNAGNPVNLSANQLPVAILSDADFDARRVDPATLTLGNGLGAETAASRRPNGSVMASLEDANGDGLLDLVVQFSVRTLVANGDVTPATTSLKMEGRLRDGLPFRGSDAIRVVP
jgi:aqualysin 1